ncbi:MAG: hypothetical protein AB7E42_05225 [Anaerotignaceae bacterium]
MDYIIGDEVTAIGLDLNQAPSEYTYYKAGSSVKMWRNKGTSYKRCIVVLVM